MVLEPVDFGGELLDAVVAAGGGLFAVGRAEGRREAAEDGSHVAGAGGGRRTGRPRRAYEKRRGGEQEGDRPDGGGHVRFFLSIGVMRGGQPLREGRSADRRDGLNEKTERLRGTGRFHCAGSLVCLPRWKTRRLKASKPPQFLPAGRSLTIFW